MMADPVTNVALLRGINVGGTNLIGMPALKELFAELGYKNVQTYLNSGNVLFWSSCSDSRALEEKIENALAPHFPERIKVLVRTTKEMEATITHTPKSWRDSNDKKCNVIFLSHAIDKPRIIDNFAPKPGIEELHYAPGVLFWSAQLDTLTKSSMLKLSTFPIYQDMTVRGLNTTRKILDLMRRTA